MIVQEPPLKAAIVGLHIHAGSLHPDKNHGLIKSFKAQEDVEVVAYCEPSPDLTDALNEIHLADLDARIYTDLDDLMTNEEFDFAVIMLPPSEAASAALNLAESGKHLFIEKQAARTATDMQQLCDVVTNKGLVTQVGYPWPYHPVPIEMKRLLNIGALGQLVDMEARLVTVQVKPGLREPDFWMYRSESEGGGILHMEGGHWLTLFRFFSDAEVKSVTSLCGRVTGFIDESLEDVATVALQFDNGVHACLHMGYLLSGAGPRNDTYFGLRGTLGAATWQPTGEGNLTVTSAAPDWEAAPERQFRVDVAQRPVYADQWGYEFVAEFIRAIRQGGKTTVTIHDACRVMQIIDASYESSRTGRRIELSSSRG